MIALAVPLWAIGLGNDTPIKLLAVIGAAAVGALVLGGVVQMVVKVAFAQKVPRWPMWGIRSLGAVASAWLVYLWLFGSGAGGLGGPGGWWGGGRGVGEGNTESTTRNKETGKAAEIGEKTKDKTKSEAPPEQTLKIEVLGNDAVKSITRSGAADVNKRYRIPGDPRLYNLADLRKLIKERRKGTPPLKRLVLIIYSDSPDRRTSQVADLESWARDLAPKLEVDLQEPDRKAPVD
jgi:hypothetical protein